MGSIMTKVAIYIRVSTTKQNIENQKLQLISYCEKSGYEVFKIYSDICGSFGKRKEYDNLFIDAHKKLFDGVIVWSLDRFSRSGITYTLQRLKELDNLGIWFHSYTEPYINSDNELTKDISIAMLSAFAKIEKEKISERTKAGLERAKKNGKKLGRKKIPQKTVDDIISLLEKGVSYRKISNEVKYKTKFGKQHKVSIGKIADLKNNMLKNFKVN
jgi:putative DNA-invertase from lambdoid prophage Rac